MKLMLCCGLRRGEMSPPAREAWIEMALWWPRFPRGTSPPAREAWIEMPPLRMQEVAKESPPAREAWIEINRPLAASKGP